MNILSGLRSKLFLKISLIFVISLTTILISTLAVHRIFFMPKRFPGFIRNIVNHANYMIKDIGIPPDLKMAEKISHKMKVPIRINFDGKEWESDSGIPEFKNIDLPVYKNFEGFSAGFNEKGLCVYYVKDSYKILLVMHEKKEGFRKVVNSLIILLLSFAILIIIVLYFFIRWLLRPVKVLKEGVDQVSAGNLNIEMPVRSTDELGQLAVSFNSMTSRIGDMITSRDQLLRDVSHELRSPLTRIKVGMELVEDSKVKQGILDDIAEVNMMISELLETDRLNSRFGKLKVEKTNIFRLINVVIKEFGSMKPGIKFENFPDDLELDLDKERVLILFRNILSNALRYSDDNGDPVRIKCEKGKNEVVIDVCDSGIGIPEDELINIFEPFYRVDKSRSRETGGYGLGMSLSKKIMDAHKGQIFVKSFPGKGTCIKLNFPTGSIN